MSSTPLWVPLAVAGMGVAGTLTAGIAGGLVAQRRADRRENEIWTRERDRERERWAREDEARTFEHRREAYADFYVAAKALARTAYDHGYGFTDEPELPEGWQDDAAGKLHRLEFYADRELAAAASKAYGAAWSWGVYGKYDDPDDPDFYERQQKYDDAELEMLALMRKSLSIPEGDLDLPPPGYSYGDSHSRVIPVWLLFLTDKLVGNSTAWDWSPSVMLAIRAYPTIKSIRGQKRGQEIRAGHRVFEVDSAC